MEGEAMVVIRRCLAGLGVTDYTIEKQDMPRCTLWHVRTGNPMPNVEYDHLKQFASGTRFNRFIIRYDGFDTNEGSCALLIQGPRHCEICRVSFFFSPSIYGRSWLLARNSNLNKSIY